MVRTLNFYFDADHNDRIVQDLLAEAIFEDYRKGKFKHFFIEGTDKLLLPLPCQVDEEELKQAIIADNIEKGLFCKPYSAKDLLLNRLRPEMISGEFMIQGVDNISLRRQQQYLYVTLGKLLRTRDQLKAGDGLTAEVEEEMKEHATSIEKQLKIDSDRRTDFSLKKIGEYMDLLGLDMAAVLYGENHSSRFIDLVRRLGYKFETVYIKCPKSTTMEDAHRYFENLDKIDPV